MRSNGLSGEVTCSAAHPVWAAFDFDGTMTRRDTLLPYLAKLRGYPSLSVVLALESPWLFAYGVRAIPNDRAKEHLLRRAVGGLSKEHLEEQGRQFAARDIGRLLRTSMMDRLHAHLKLGHRCVVVTASLALYVRPWAEAVGFADVIGSELEFDADGMATGRLLRGNCYGPEKVRRLLSHPAGHALRYAYGDSLGDREMLAMADLSWLLGRGNDYGGVLPRLE